MGSRTPHAAGLLESGEPLEVFYSRGPDEATALIHNDEKNTSSSWWGGLSLASLGPALVCCLADGDAGSLIVAAQSGSRWQYRLTLVQIMLVPILFSILEALVRVAVSEKRGFGAMVRAHFGMKCAVLALVLLLISCFGAIVSEMSGISSVAALWGTNKAAASIFTAAFVISIVLFCDYRQVELVALFFGLFELVFVIALFWVPAWPHEAMNGMFDFKIHSNSFLRMLAANIGAVVMPWMLYFQQSAVVARRLTTEREVAQERTQSLLGSFMAQLIMVATMLVLAATPQEAKDLDGILGIQVAIAPYFGVVPAKILVSLAFFGGSVCAIFVVSLAAAWAICDTIGGPTEDPFSLDKSISDAPGFYCSFVFIVFAGALVLLAFPNVIKLNVYIEVLNAFMVPMSLLFLFLVVTGKSMPVKLQISGVHRGVLLCLFALTSAVALSSTVLSLIPANNVLESNALLVAA